MKSRRIAAVEDDPKQDGQDLNEFNEEEIRQLGERRSGSLGRGGSPRTTWPVSSSPFGTIWIHPLFGGL